MTINQALYQRLQKIQQMYEQADGELSVLSPIEHLLSQVSDTLYSTDFRFIIELIQNAVDSHRVERGESVPVQVRFYLDQDKLIVANDGQPFSETDIDRICGVVKHRKGRDKIGYKGIGFKSVAGITHNPQIYSAGCQFQFDKRLHPHYEYVWLLIPHWIVETERPDYGQDEQWVTIALPFKPDFSTEMLQKLSRHVNQTSGALLLFLKHLGMLEIENRYASKYLALRKRVETDGLTYIESRQQTDQNEWREYGRWLVVSHRSNNPPAKAQEDYIKRRGLKANTPDQQPDLGPTEIIIAYHINPDGLFVPKQGPVYAFFSVENQSSGLRFTIHSDFLTTLSRENLVPNSPWNDWLLENLPLAIETSLEALKKHPQRQPLIYEVLPLPHEGTDLFKPIIQTLLKRLQSYPLILTNHPKQWVTPQETMWLPPELRDLLTDSDLQQGWPHKKAFVSEAIDVGQSRIKSCLFESLQVERFTHVHLLTFLEDTDWLAKKGISWFRTLFRYLPNLIGTQQQQQLRQLAIIPTNQGLVSATTPHVYLPVTLLNPPTHQTLSPQWQEAVDLSASQTIKDLLKICAENGLDLPESGYELTDNQGKVVGMAELAWPNMQVAVFVVDDKAGYQTFLQAGWHVFWQTELEAIIAELQQQAVIDSYQKLSGVYLVKPELLEHPEVQRFLEQQFGLQAVTPAQVVRKLILPSLQQSDIDPMDVYHYTEFAIKHYQHIPELQHHLQQILLLTAADGSPQLLNRLCLDEVNGQATLANYLLAPEGNRYLVSRTGWVGNYHYLNLPHQPPIDVLVEFLQQATFDDKPILWFQVLFTYLADKPLFELQTIPFIPIQDSDDCLAATENIYFPLTTFDLPDIFSGVYFIDPTLFNPPSKTAPFPVNIELIQQFLQQLGVTELDPINLIQKTVIEQFNQANKTNHYPDHLLDYTAFVMYTLQHHPHRETWQQFNQVVRLKTTAGSWLSPTNIYITAIYGGVDFENFFINIPQMAFVSADYLQCHDNESDWYHFFEKLGVQTQLNVQSLRPPPKQRLNHLQAESPHLTSYLQTVIETKVDGQEQIELHGLNYHRLVNHITLPWLGEMLPNANAEQLTLLLQLLASSWQLEWETVMYEQWWQQQALPLVEKPSHLMWQLHQQPLIPTSKGIKRIGETTLYLDIPTIRQLVGPQVAYLEFDITETQQPFFERVLQIICDPTQVNVADVKAHLRYLKHNGTASIKQTLAIYQYLLEQREYGLLEREALIYLPNQGDEWWRPSELFWDDYQTEFGSLRGYLVHTYPDAQPVFVELGVNISPPTPQDWATLLLTEPADTTLIWQAYKMLEQALQEQPDLVKELWWQSFEQQIRLLTEQGTYIFPQSLYLPDPPNWYEKWQLELPFIKLPNQQWQGYQTFCKQLGIRSLSDWLRVDVEAGEPLYLEIAEKAHEEIMTHLPFIFSILAHKAPHTHLEYELNLQRLAAPDFSVCLVDQLVIYLEAIAHPELTPKPEKRRAYFDATHLTLYVNVVGDREHLREDIGAAVASMFGPLEKMLRTDLMTLFGRITKQTKYDLLNQLDIRYFDWPRSKTPTLPPLPTEQWQPRYQPYEVVAVVPETYPHQAIKETALLYDTDTPQSLTDEDKRVVGKWGEQYAYACLRRKFDGSYQAETIVIEWLNETGEQGEPYDIRVTIGEKITYYEVKTTHQYNLVWFMSMEEWMFASAQQEQYRILRVFFAGTEQVSIVDIKNPIQQWRDGKLSINHSIRVEMS